MEENKEIKDLLKDIVSKMDEVLMWLRLGLQKNVAETLGSVFESDEQKVAFELSDGKTANQIGELIGKTGRTVQYWWEDWEKKGFVTGKRKKIKRFSLKDLGIEVPPPEELKKKAQESA